MSFFHVRTLPGYDWPALPDAAFSPVWAAYLELERTQWLSAQEIEHRQLQQVRNVLAHGIVHVPYYRRTLTAAGVSPGAVQTMEAFRRIPLLPRHTYQEHQEELIAAGLPPGTQEAGKISTSGSTGRPLDVLQTQVVQLWWYAFFLRDLEWAGLDPMGKLASIRGTGATGTELQRLLEGICVSSWLPPLARLIDSGPAHGMAVYQDHRRQLQWLRGIEPDYLLSYATNLDVLASLLEEEGRGLTRLRAIQAVSDPLAPEVQARIERAFGVPVRNTYSCCEAGYLATSCPQHPGLHVHAENVILEVLDDAGLPCGPGQTGRVYLTTLHNFRTPFLRYQLGDLARVAPSCVGPSSCPCGRGLPLLETVEGKARPMFRLPDGRLKSSYGLSYFLRDVGGHHQHQMIQKAVDHVVVRIVPAAGWTPEHAERLRLGVQNFFETPIRVDVEITERMEMPASGKFKSIVCELDCRSDH